MNQSPAISTQTTTLVSNQPRIRFRKTGLVFASITLFIVLGNLSRVITLPGLRDNVPLVSFIAYGACTIYAIFHKATFHFALRLWPVYAVIAFSCIYGIYLNGFVLNPVLYAVRLIWLIFSATAASHILFRRYKNSSQSAFNFIVSIYAWVLLIGFLLYVFFPNSISFWFLLADFGIVFNGDPHQNRFYSSYFDPNYYAVIACFPLIICAMLYQVYNTRRHLILFGLIAASIILSGSRSGIATMIFVIAMLSLEQMSSIRHIRFRKRTLQFALLAILVALACLPLYINPLLFLLDRTVSIGNDPSALGRSTSFDFGLTLLNRFPLLGVGYNYQSEYLDSYTLLSSVYSSLLSTAINFGIPITIFVLILFIRWAVHLWKDFSHSGVSKTLKAIDQRITRHFLLYLVFVIGFSSQFNNVLYYEYWLFPVIMVAGYLSFISEARQSRSNT